MIDETILNVLRKRTGDHVSGEELCKHAEISRAAIWKRIEKLREEGYEIEASPHLGYRLLSAPDRLIPSEIKWALATHIIGREIISYNKVDSTNDVAYALAEKGMKEGTVIISEEQSRGKGRLGRSWISPPKGGIYLSCILRPVIAPSQIPMITLTAAVAVAKTIRQASGLSANIKWPNDIMIDGRKICGILTEMKAEQDKVDFVIVGIGINVNTAHSHLPKGASSIFCELQKAGREENVSRIELTKMLFENMEKEYILLNKGAFDSIIKEWKNYSEIIGSRIRVVQQNRSFDAQAYDVDRDGSLIVRLESGILQNISSGDVVISK